MRYTGSEVHMGWTTHGEESEVPLELGIHGVGYTRNGVYTEWDSHGVRYTQSGE